MKSNTLSGKTFRLDWEGASLDRFAREMICKRLSRIKGATVKISDPYGDWKIGEGVNPDVEIAVFDTGFYRDVILAGSKGAAAAYRDGKWDCSDLTSLLRIMIRNISLIDTLETGTSRLMNFCARLAHMGNRNDRSGSRKNIHDHYDLGNDLFENFLDPSMTYSCGIFNHKDTSLEEASITKLDMVCRKLRLNPSDHIVEIGTGWGSFALHAAGNYGCRVTTTTISTEQYRLAKERIRQAGLKDRIDVLLTDYRDLDGQYDKLVSIEMIEAVGNEFMGDYFAKCASLVKADGQILIQAITMPDQRYAEYLKRSDFIQQYIFPGSCVPSLTAMLKSVADRSKLRVESIENFGPHYARTLRCWRDNFRRNQGKIEMLGYSQGFMRLWEYYLCYCEAGFMEKYLGTVHLHLSAPEFERPALQEK